MNLVRALFRVDVRRAAAWLALVAGVAAGAILPLAPAGRPALEASWLAGACLAMASIGAPLVAPAAPLVGVDAPAALRAAWPAVGILAGAAGALVAGAAPRAAVTTLLLLVGALAATRLRVEATRRGASDADAISLALGIAGAAALASWGILPDGARGGLRAAVIAAAWGGFVAAVAALEYAADHLGPARVAAVRGGVLPPASPVRRGLVSASMLVAIGGMAVWLFLLPGRAATDACVTLVAFAAVAVPAALVSDDRLDPRWRQLLASVPPRFTARHRRPGWGPPRTIEWLHAAILGWPPLVASLLLARESSAAVAALAVAGATAAAAAATAAIGARTLPLGPPEARLAAALAGALAIGLAALFLA